MYGYEIFSKEGAKDSFVLKIAYGTFMAAGNFIILNMFISAINSSATIVREDPEQQNYDKDVGDYISVSHTSLHIHKSCAPTSL